MMRKDERLGRSEAGGPGVSSPTSSAKEQEQEAKSKLKAELHTWSKTKQQQWRSSLLLTMSPDLNHLQLLH